MTHAIHPFDALMDSPRAANRVSSAAKAPIVGRQRQALPRFHAGLGGQLLGIRAGHRRCAGGQAKLLLTPSPAFYNQPASSWRRPWSAIVASTRCSLPFRVRKPNEGANQTGAQIRHQIQERRVRNHHFEGGFHGRTLATCRRRARKRLSRCSSRKCRDFARRSSTTSPR